MEIGQEHSLSQNVRQGLGGLRGHLALALVVRGRVDNTSPRCLILLGTQQPAALKEDAT